jgi:hypothetical protein
MDPKGTLYEEYAKVNWRHGFCCGFILGLTISFIAFNKNGYQRKN